MPDSKDWRIYSRLQQSKAVISETLLLWCRKVDCAARMHLVTISNVIIHQCITVETFTNYTNIPLSNHDIWQKCWLIFIIWRETAWFSQILILYFLPNLKCCYDRYRKIPVCGMMPLLKHATMEYRIGITQLRTKSPRFDQCRRCSKQNVHMRLFCFHSLVKFSVILAKV